MEIINVRRVSKSQGYCLGDASEGRCKGKFKNSGWIQLNQEGNKWWIFMDTARDTRPTVKREVLNNFSYCGSLIFN
jgi:hypothetical protein